MSELFFEGRRWGSPELAPVVQRAGDLLSSAGLAEGDRILVSLTNSIDHLALLLAAWHRRVGVVEVPPTASSNGLMEALRRTGAGLAVVDSHAADRLLRSLREGEGDAVHERSIPSFTGSGAVELVACTLGAASRRPQRGSRPEIDLARLDTLLEGQPPAVFFTSGSTSTAKGVLLRWDRILRKGLDVLAFYGESATRAVAPVLPLSHVYGLYLALGGLALGSTVVVCRETQNPGTIIDSLVTSGTTTVVCPPLIARLLFGRRDPESPLARTLRVVSVGGAATPQQTVQRIRAKLPDVKLILSYGLVETYSTVCCVDVTSQPERATSVGPFRWQASGEIRDPASGLPLASGQVGELCIGGDITDGYLGHGSPGDGPFTKDGLLRTGDLAELSADGFVTLRGRAKDVFNLGGLTADPAEVEEVLGAHPAVADCGVFADTGSALEVVLAAIVLDRAPATVDIEDILRHCAARLAGPLRPRRIYVVDEIPRGALGKVERSVLRAKVMATREEGSEW